MAIISPLEYFSQCQLFGGLSIIVTNPDGNFTTEDASRSNGLFDIFDRSWDWLMGRSFSRDPLNIIKALGLLLDRCQYVAPELLYELERKIVACRPEQNPQFLLPLLKVRQLLNKPVTDIQDAIGRQLATGSLTPEWRFVRANIETNSLSAITERTAAYHTCCALRAYAKKFLGYSCKVESPTPAALQRIRLNLNSLLTIRLPAGLAAEIRKLITYLEYKFPLLEDIQAALFTICDDVQTIQHSKDPQLAPLLERFEELSRRISTALEACAFFSNCYTNKGKTKRLTSQYQACSTAIRRIRQDAFQKFTPIDARRPPALTDPDCIRILETARGLSETLQLHPDDDSNSTMFLGLLGCKTRVKTQCQGAPAAERTALIDFITTLEQAVERNPGSSSTSVKKFAVPNARRLKFTVETLLSSRPTTTHVTSLPEGSAVKGFKNKGTNCWLISLVTVLEGLDFLLEDPNSPLDDDAFFAPIKARGNVRLSDVEFAEALRRRLRQAINVARDVETPLNPSRHIHSLRIFIIKRHLGIDNWSDEELASEAFKDYLETDDALGLKIGLAGKLNCDIDNTTIMQAKILSEIKTRHLDASEIFTFIIDTLASHTHCPIDASLGLSWQRTVQGTFETPPASLSSKSVASIDLELSNVQHLGEVDGKQVFSGSFVKHEEMMHILHVPMTDNPSDGGKMEGISEFIQSRRTGYVNPCQSAHLAADNVNRYDWYRTETRALVATETIEQLIPENLPPHLIISIKRFASREVRNPTTKAVTVVPYKNDNNFNIDPRISMEDITGTTADYEVESISQHSGGLQGGHYTTVTFRGGRWHEVNDGTVRVSGEIPTTDEERYANYRALFEDPLHPFHRFTKQGYVVHYRRIQE